MNNFFRQLLFGIDNYNINQQNLINEKKNNKIKKITIYRKPIDTIIKQSLNVLSLGRFLKNLKNSPYDEIYHLYMVIFLDDNINLLLEKNERINLVKINTMEVINLNYNKNVQNMEVEINNEILFIDLLNKTYKNMGVSYFKYSSNQYNCQNFIYNILNSNDLLNEKLEKFIYQDPSFFFQKLNYLTKFNNAITSLGAKIDLIRRGSGIKEENINKILINDKKYKFNSNKKRNKFIKIMDDDIIVVFYN